MIDATAAYGVAVRDLKRSARQRGRLLGGIARPLLWLLLVTTGFDTIARVEGAASYRVFALPGVVVMASLFGAMLTAIGTVYDREFGMLRAMLASPAGIPNLLAGRVAGATLIGALQGAVVLLLAPLFVPVSAKHLLAAALVLLGCSAVNALLGLLLAARLRSVENFAGVINTVLFPLLFASGALYPTERMPGALRMLARVNPVTYEVDLLRQAMGERGEFAVTMDLSILAAVVVLACVLTALLFDPEARLLPQRRREQPA
jgi:ABC-2 type transport system permease protein